MRPPIFLQNPLLSSPDSSPKPHHQTPQDPTKIKITPLRLERPSSSRYKSPLSLSRLLLLLWLSSPLLSSSAMVVASSSSRRCSLVLWPPPPPLCLGLPSGSLSRQPARLILVLSLATPPPPSIPASDGPDTRARRSRIRRPRARVAPPWRAPPPSDRGREVGPTRGGSESDATTEPPRNKISLPYGSSMGQKPTRGGCPRAGKI